MMETPLGILNAREIAFADPSVGCFAMGTSDLAKDLRCRHTPDRTPFLYALEHCIMVVFAPLDSEVAWAEKIIAAHGEAAKAGQGLVVVDGKLIENLHVAEAQRLMAMHENIQSREA